MDEVRASTLRELGRPDWDLLVSVFTQTDRVAHMFYRLLDPDHPRYDAVLAARFGDAVLRVYQRMDAIVGEVLARLGPEATLLVVSDHGFHSYRTGLNVNTWLRDHGYLVQGPLAPGAETEDFSPGVDWSRTRAYALGTGQIYVNLRGREGRGVVGPGAEYDALLDAIARGLEAEVDPATGERFVARVYQGREIFPGAPPERMPDLQLAFRDGYRTSWRTPLGGIPKDLLEPNLKKWSGDHAASDVVDTPGVILASRRLAADDPAIVDLARTALAYAVARFRIIRDLFLEQVPHGLVPLAVQVGALAVVALGAVLLWRALRGADERRAALTRPGIAAVVVALLAAAWAGGAQLKPPPAPAPLPPRAAPPAGAPNVVLIMVDTLRADHLSCYGSAAVKTPHIDALAADGLRWTSAFSQASWTRPSVATILTGLYPSSHGAVHKADRLPDRVDTLAEVLGRAGYHTVGFADNANVSQAFNFHQGFDEYHYLAPDFFFSASEPAAHRALYSGLSLVRERFLAHYVDVHHYYQPAEVVTAEVRRWLDRGARDEPFFLFAHYMDPHDPYFAHPFNGEGYRPVPHPNPPPPLPDRLHPPYEAEGASLQR